MSAEERPAWTRQDVLLVAGAVAVLLVALVVVGGWLAALIGAPLGIVTFWGATYVLEQLSLSEEGRRRVRSVDDVVKLRESAADPYRRLVRSGAFRETRSPSRSESSLGGTLEPASANSDAEEFVPAPRADAKGRQVFWRRLSRTEQDALERVARPQTFRAGDALCVQGETGDRVFVIKSGWAKVEVDGRVIAGRGEGDLIGERAAFRSQERSASVYAIDELVALSVSTADFTDFVATHPRVLAAIEDQVYNRLTEPPAGPRFVLDGQICAIFMFDIGSFNAAYRTDLDRGRMRDAMYGAVREVVEAIGSSWAECHHEDRGDGVLVVLPPTIPTGKVVMSLIDGLPRSLRAHNRFATPEARFQARLAMHVGPVKTDGEGLVSEAINMTSRLLDAQVFKKRLAASESEVGFMFSDHVYGTVVRHVLEGRELTRYERVDFRVKESKLRGWLDLPRPDPGGNLRKPGMVASRGSLHVTWLVWSVSPGLIYRLRGIPFGWSCVVLFAERRPRASVTFEPGSGRVIDRAPACCVLRPGGGAGWLPPGPPGWGRFRGRRWPCGR